MIPIKPHVLIAVATALNAAAPSNRSAPPVRIRLEPTATPS